MLPKQILQQGESTWAERADLARRYRTSQGVMVPMTTRLGFGPAKLDKSSAIYGAIRGREQELIDMMQKLGTSANKINGISSQNPNRTVYCKQCRMAFGTSK